MSLVVYVRLPLVGFYRLLGFLLGVDSYYLPTTLPLDKVILGLLFSSVLLLIPVINLRNL